MSNHWFILILRCYLCVKAFPLVYVYFLPEKQIYVIWFIWNGRYLLKIKNMLFLVLFISYNGCYVCVNLKDCRWKVWCSTPNGDVCVPDILCRGCSLQWVHQSKPYIQNINTVDKHTHTICTCSVPFFVITGQPHTKAKACSAFHNVTVSEHKAVRLKHTDTQRNTQSGFGYGPHPACVSAQAKITWRHPVQWP